MCIVCQLWLSLESPSSTLVADRCTRPLTFLYDIQCSTTFVWSIAIVFAAFSCKVNFLISCNVLQMEWMMNHYLLGRGFFPFTFLIRDPRFSGVQYPVVIIVYMRGQRNHIFWGKKCFLSFSKKICFPFFFKFPRLIVPSILEVNHQWWGAFFFATPTFT